MRVKSIDIPGPLIIEPEIHNDRRGLFLQTYAAANYARNGIDAQFVQDNCSWSREKGTIRGLHYQAEPKTQAKLIHVLKGSIWNVIVDLRSESRWFGKWYGVELTAESCRQLFVPGGFANGFCSLTDDATVFYKVDNYYSPEHERGFAWNDPMIGISWPKLNPILSDRDRSAPPFDPSQHCFSGLLK